MAAPSAPPPPAPPPPAAAIVLAGGTGRRLGGASKPDYLVAGRRLIDIAVEEIRAVAPEARIVAVAPGNVAIPAGTERTLEDPPFGGPRAGLAAGLARLEAPEPLGGDDVVALLSVDAPLAPRLWPELAARLAADLEAEGAAPAADGFTHYLLGLYRVRALRRALGGETRGRSVRSAFRSLAILPLENTRGYTLDVDTQADAAKLAALLGE